MNESRRTYDLGPEPSASPRHAGPGAAYPSLSSGTFTLAQSALTNSDADNKLSGKLTVVINDCGKWSGGVAPDCITGVTEKYTGTIGAMGTVALGSFASSDKHRYEFKVSFPSGSGDDVYQGDSMSVQYDWSASS